MNFRLPLLALGLAFAAAACSEAPPPESGVSASAQALTVGGCTCVSSGTCSAVSYSDVPADGQYYITTFGGGSDTQPMSCGGTADGTWAYVAGRARFGCGAKLLVSSGGKQCVAEVADCGPNRCVEEAASSSSCADHFPIIDASPYISKYLLGVSSAGWSEKKIVKATLVDASSTVGCPGVVAGGSGGGGGSGGTSSGGSSGSGGTPATCSPPDCSNCGGCYEQCMCDVGDPFTCNDTCFGSGGASGSGGSAGTSGSGGATPSSCGPPLCNGCANCYDQCVCDGTNPSSCQQICASESEPPGPNCAAPNCGGCSDCYDSCMCNGGNVADCVSSCTPADEPGVKTPQPVSVPESNAGSCGAASIIGPRGNARTRDVLLVTLALSMLGLRARRRKFWV